MSLCNLKSYLGTNPKILATEFGCDSESSIVGGKQVGDWCIDFTLALDDDEEYEYTPEGYGGVPEGANMTNVCPCSDKDLCQVQ